MTLRLATRDENSPGDSPPDSEAVARRPPGWLFPEAENMMSQLAPPPITSSTEKGSIFTTDGGAELTARRVR
jgi:hypothetical protein